MGENIFTVLGKYSSASEENYLTEAFVFLVKHLLDRDRPVAIQLLTNLCIDNDEFVFDLSEPISIATQVGTEQGRPDIEISTLDKLLFIEVKHDSGLGYRQLERYSKVLEESGTEITKLILLTRFSIDLKDEEAKLYKHVKWFEVYNWLAEEKPADPVSRYLVRSFLDFLEEKKMSMQKVEREYIEGVPAFVNLMNMIEVAIKSTSLSIYSKSAGWEWKGFYLNNKDYFCGVYYSDPLSLVFELEFEAKPSQEILAASGYRYDKTPGGKIYLALDLEAEHFFVLNKDEQLETISTFLKEVYATAQKIPKP